LTEFGIVSGIDFMYLRIKPKLSFIINLEEQEREYILRDQW